MKHQKVSNLFNVAIYIRLSREDGDKEESDSVGNQRKLLTEYVAKKEDFILYDIYVDDGYSGTNFNRPSFQKMIADIEDGKVNCVVVKDLSRFGRDYIDTGRYLERYFPELGVRFISVTDSIDSMKQAYDMLLPIKNIFNEQYARDISKKIQATVKSKQKAGEFIGAFTSYGYKKSPVDKNKLVIDDYAADVVRRIFSLYIQGYGKQRIAKLLNSEGILCPAEYKKVNGENYKNCNRLESTTYWSYSTINSILHREMYVGNMVQGTKHQRMRSKQKKMPKEEWIIVENTHEPIIDKETWEKAQSLLQKRTRELGLETNKNIFAGFVKCGDCGRAMTKNMWRRADGSKTYSLYCGTYKRNGKQYCTPHTLPMAVLEDIVLGDLKAIVDSVDNLKELVQSQSFTASKVKRIADTELSKIKAELERVKRLKKSIYEDYREELISKEEFLSYREDYLKKEELYSKQIEALEEKKKDNVTEDVFETPWIKRLLELKDIETLDRDIVVEMISEIKVYENRKIKITYNFGNELEHLFSSVYSVESEEKAI
ncbi:MAG: recombinase family protein [Blautia producta]|uniref:recombinase family protein n=1 Tax=Blautia producta TaxID=33035 RepID=UPI002914CD0F|nr:recombinase family protein [Blautia producta]MDU5384778.1 recombinase family protein [Blautia producta]MDU6885501.1 recombinase family protein [Blautia producta]